VQHFHRDGLLDVDVLAAIDRAHAAAAEDLVEPVVTDRRAETRDVFFLDENSGVVKTEPLPVGKPREAAWANLDGNNASLLSEAELAEQ
jgi:hypothetical protein